MRGGSIKEYMAFQTDFKPCLKNLERSGLAKAREELKVDFIEKLTEESATHLMLTPFADSCTGEVGMVKDLESAMEMARSYFAVQDTKTRIFSAEEINLSREARFNGRRPALPAASREVPRPMRGRLMPGQASRCDSCGGRGHLARGCPNHRRAGGADPTKLCSICGGTGHDSLDHRLPGVGCFEEQDLLDLQGGKKLAAEGPGGDGGASATGGDCWIWRSGGGCRFGDRHRFRDGPNDTRHVRR